MASPAVIRVLGHGAVTTPPDLAVISFGVRGEEVTSDEALRALVAKQERIEAALAGSAAVRTGRLAAQAVRDRACDGKDEEDDGRPRLSKRVCAIKAVSRCSA